MKCQRCGSPDVSWQKDTVTLAGGVTASLCGGCRTAWDRLIKDHPILEQMIAHEARTKFYDSLAEAGQLLSEERWLEHGRANAAIARELHDIGAEFVRPINVAAARRDDD